MQTISFSNIFKEKPADQVDQKDDQTKFTQKLSKAAKKRFQKYCEIADNDQRDPRWKKKVAHRRKIIAKYFTSEKKQSPKTYGLINLKKQLQGG